MDAAAELKDDFGQDHFGQAPLGDLRRRRRLVALANRMADRPGPSLPNQVQDPAAYQALLRLARHPKVTHPAVLQTHRQRTLQRARQHPGTVLFIHDITELDYTSKKSLKNLGQIGDGRGRGYECFNCLAVDGDTDRPLGLAHQILHRRANVPKGETVAAKRARQSRESLLWVKSAAAIHKDSAPLGPPPPGHREIDVCDRGADDFQFLDAQDAAGRTYVVRSSHNRRIYVGHQERTQEALLHDHLRSLPEAGRRTIDVPAVPARAARAVQPAVPAQKARLATVAVCFAAVQVRRPHVKRGQYRNEPLLLWAVRVWEIDAPAGVEPLEWILLTNYPVVTLADAERVLGWYEKRWLIEEFHKAKKTGCGIEKAQFTQEERLQPVIALLSVLAVRLLLLRWLSRQEELKERPAVQVAPAAYVGVLSVTESGRRRLDLTVWEFFLGVARLGGYGYYHKDSPPGWLVLWRGWGQLHSRVAYALAAGVESWDPTDDLPQPELAASLLDKRTDWT